MKTRPDSRTTETTMNYFTATPESVDNRLKELEKEWDLERVHELNASFSGLNGTLLGKILDKHFASLPFSTSTRLVNETPYEWNPSITLFESLGYRPKHEIEKEKQFLQTLKNEADSDFFYSPAAVA